MTSLGERWGGQHTGENSSLDREGPGREDRSPHSGRGRETERRKQLRVISGVEAQGLSNGLCRR